MRLHYDFGVLRDHDYRQLFASTTVSQFGFQVTQIAVSLVAIDHLGASEFQVGLLATVQFAAFLLIGLPAGAWVDRMRRRNVLVVSDLGRALLLASVPLAWWAGVLTIWQLYAVALLHGALTVFFDVAYQSYLPHLVGRTHLVEGNARLEAVRAVSQVAGPSVAGQLVRLLTAPVALFADAIAMAASALFLGRIRKPEPRPVRHPDAHLAREIREGLRYVLGHRLLRAIVGCTGTYNFFSNVSFAMVIFFLRRTLGLDAGEIGLVLSVFGIGGVLGAFAARPFANWLGQGPAIWMSCAFFTPFTLLIPLAEHDWRVWAAAAAGGLSSAGGVIYNVTQVSFRQALTPDHLLGRMNATIRFLVWGTIPIGGLVGAFLGEWLGARTTILIGALGMCLAFLPVLLSPLRTMRTLPTHPDVPEPAQA